MLAGCGDYSTPTVDFSPEAEQLDEAGLQLETGEGVPFELPVAERRRPLVAIRECNLERIDGKLFSTTADDVAKSSSVTLSGWIASAEAKNVPGFVQIRMVNVTDKRSWAIAGKTGRPREDVRMLLGGDHTYSGAGFAIELDAASMPVGDYRLYAVFEEGGTLKVCDNGRGIRVID